MMREIPGIDYGTEVGTVNTERPTLKRGSSCADVKTLQILLIARGYALRKYGVCSIFCGETEDAVKAFQRANKLVVDGIVGPASWAALTSPETATQPMYRLTCVSPDKAALDKLAAQYGGTVEVIA